MTTERKNALAAAIAIIIMALVAGFSFGYAHNLLIIPDDIDATIKNLKYAKLLFQFEIIGWMIILICDVLASWALYKFFIDENKKFTYAMALSRVIYTAFFAVAIFKLINVLTIVENPFTTSGEVLSNLNSFDSIWSWGLIIFGLHLIFLGILALKNKTLHNVFGILLVVAGVCYTSIHLAKNLMPAFVPQINNIEMVLSAPMAIGEIAFAFWLLIRGGKPKSATTKSIITQHA